ncbi:MAG: hypothetical protein MJZ81_07725 [Bacteroidales bacterium]|nr:hypothetical protein [Bacteroidales bacterium]
MVNWKRKLTSRKLWVALAGFVSGILIACGKTEAEATQVAALIMSAASVVGYVIGEGLVDAGGWNIEGGDPSDDGEQ